jgi:hypothetical protein
MLPRLQAVADLYAPSLPDQGDDYEAAYFDGAAYLKRTDKIGPGSLQEVKARLFVSSFVGR